MKATLRDKKQDRLIAKLSRLGKDRQDQTLLADMFWALDSRYDLGKKIAREPGVEDILTQMAGRIVNAFGKLSTVHGMRILDIACGSNTSKAPASLYIDIPFGEMTFGRSTKGYTAQFEPWFCRMLFELGADPVGIDMGDLEHESFVHYRADLGQIDVLNFLPARSFDAVQDSRLFGSPEFTAQFPDPAERLQVAREIMRQEQRLLKPGGIVIYSDATRLLR
jgi:SAM-dependent methyltransferase